MYRTTKAVAPMSRLTNPTSLDMTHVYRFHDLQLRASISVFFGFCFFDKIKSEWSHDQNTRNVHSLPTTAT